MLLIFATSLIVVASSSTGSFLSEETTISVKDGQYYIVSGEFGQGSDKYLSLHINEDYVAHYTTTAISGGLAGGLGLVASMLPWFLSPCAWMGAGVFGVFTLALGLSPPNKKALTLAQDRPSKWVVFHKPEATAVHKDAFLIDNGWAESKLRSMHVSMRSNGLDNTLALHQHDTTPIVAVKSEFGPDLVYLLLIGHENGQPDAWVHLHEGWRVSLDLKHRSLWKLKRAGSTDVVDSGGARF